MYRVQSLVSWFDLCGLLCFLCSFPGPFRAGCPGRLVPVGSGCASQRRAVSRVLAYPGRRLGLESKVAFGPGFPIGEAVRRRLGSEAGASVGEMGQSSGRAGAVSLRLDVPAGDWAALSACCFRLLGRTLAWKPVPEGPRVYEPDNAVPVSTCIGTVDGQGTRTCHELM